jgi:putative nucleotidyltransferase with HDIG domain
MSSSHPDGFKFIEGLTQELSSKTLIFPTSLNITMRIRHALNDPDASTHDVARIVGTEPVLSGQLLRLCNSAAFSKGGKPVSELRTAIARLGFEMVRNVAIAIGMQQLKQSQARGEVPPAIEGLWKRSIRIAALCYVMARRLTRLNPDTAMLAGLLHDIGKFYILNRARNYGTLFADEKALWEIVDHWHADIGEAILESWEIPNEISAAVRDCRVYRRTRFGPPDCTDVLSAADYIDALSYPAKHAEPGEAPAGALGRLELDLDGIDILLQAAKEELALIFQALS